MPLRLPLRRRMGPTAAPPFRRRSPPTPQATRLMRVALVSGLIFLAVLGAVFIPRALESQGIQPPVIALRVTGQDPFIVTVDHASRSYPLTDYRGESNATNSSASFEVILLGPDLRIGSWAQGNVTFNDTDRDERLSLGDQFRIVRKPGTGWGYLILIFWKPRDVGGTTPYPFAAGRLSWNA